MTCAFFTLCPKLQYGGMIILDEYWKVNLAKMLILLRVQPIFHGTGFLQVVLEQCLQGCFSDYYHLTKMQQ